MATLFFNALVANTVRSSVALFITSSLSHSPPLTTHPWYMSPSKRRSDSSNVLFEFVLLQTQQWCRFKNKTKSNYLYNNKQPGSQHRRHFTNRPTGTASHATHGSRPAICAKYKFSCGPSSFYRLVGKESKLLHAQRTHSWFVLVWHKQIHFPYA